MCCELCMTSLLWPVRITNNFLKRNILFEFNNSIIQFNNMTTFFLGVIIRYIGGTALYIIERKKMWLWIVTPFFRTASYIFISCVHTDSHSTSKKMSERTKKVNYFNLKFINLNCTFCERDSRAICYVISYPCPYEIYDTTFDIHTHKKYC